MTIDPAAPLESLPQFLSPDEARQWLRIGRTTVYELLHSGAIPSIRLGRSIRIKREALGKLQSND